MIPNTFHRIWLDDPEADTFLKYWDRFQELHPDWVFCSWNSSDNIPTLKNQDLFDRAQKVCPKDWKRFKADILRLELLYQFGGIYVDTDIEPLRPFDHLCEHSCIVPFSPNRGPRGKRLLTQYVIGAEPFHPFIAACIEGIPEAVEHYGHKPLAQMIGPHHITRTWELGRWDDVTTLPEHIFSDRMVPYKRREEILALHKWNTGRRRRGRSLG